jgi:hypothetical protein
MDFRRYELPRAIHRNGFENRKRIKFEYAKPQKWSDGKERDSFVYEVLEVGKHFISAGIEGETRKTVDGEIVKRDFMFISVDEFVWHRTDRNEKAAAPPAARCSDENYRLTVKVGQ